MERQDDPEARIRDLERPLADRAQSSELGTTAYTAPYSPPYTAQEHFPPPPPPPGWPQPYSSAPPVAHTGNRSGWLVFVGVAVALVIAGAGALIWFAMRPGDGAVVGNPTASGGGGPIDEAPQLPSIPSIPPLPVLPSGLPGLPEGIPGMPGGRESVTGGPGEVVSVSGVQGVKTVACNDSVVNVSGVANVVTITGQCASVSVSGINNEITVDAAASLSASGFDNTIIYKSGEPQLGSVTESNVIRPG